jgi:hypothetical protein
MVKLIAVSIKALETLLTTVTSKRSNPGDIGNLGNEAHRENSETIVVITFKIKSSYKLCAVFVRFWLKLERAHNF